MAAPDVVVELALTSGYTTPAASRTWTDITSYVEAQNLISIDRGRGDQFSAPQPSRLTLTLNNTDGRFTPENTAGAYYPNIKKGRPIRVRAASTVTIAADTFTAADSTTAFAGRTTPTGGFAWTTLFSPVFGILTNRAYNTSSGGVVYVNVGQADVTYSCDYTVGTSLNSSGLAFRVVDANNFLSIHARSSGQWVIRKFVAGVATDVATGGTAATSTTYSLQVVTSGTSVSLYVGGVLTLSTTISQLSTATGFGLEAAAATGGHFWDNFSVSTSGYADRFMGYVDEWPVEWPGDSSTWATTTITAMSRQARIGRGATLKSIVEEEYLYDGPKAYWTLSEPQGSTTAGNIAAGRSEILTVAQAGTGGTLEFGTATGPGTDDLSAPTLTPVDGANGLYLVTPLGSDLIPTGATFQALEVSFASVWSGTGPNYVAHLTTDQSAATNLRDGLYIATDGGGLLEAGFKFGAVGNATFGPFVADGNVHHVVVLMTLSGGNVTTNVMLDGSVVATYGPTAWPYSVGGTPSFYTPTRLIVGGGAYVISSVPTVFGVWPGSVSHVAVYASASSVTTTRFAQHQQAGATGFSGEASGARVARYARLAGIPTAEISVETGLSPSIAHKDTTGELPASLMQAVAETEDGVVFDGKDGTVTFHSRSHRYGATSAFTLSTAAGDVEGGLVPKLDDQHLTNDMTASRPNGITVRSVNQPSIDEYGYYRETLEVLTTSDNEVQARADWEVNRFGTPRVSVPNLAVDLTTCSSTLQNALLAADIGTKFTVTGLPSQAPASTMDFFIEGISERIGTQSYGIEFNVSAAAYANVWQLDSATLSQLDSSTVLAY